MSQFDPVKPLFHHAPLKVAEETYLIQELSGEGTGAPVSVYMNSAVIRGCEPVIVDTGNYGNREQWLNDVFSLVEPKDVKWIFLSHDDHDHTGNLREALELCENATLVTNWFTMERISGELHLPLERMRWVNDGDSFDAGDRTFAAVRPPIFDAPTTRGLYDSRTGFYWASDSFATPVPRATAHAADLDPQFWAEGFSQFARMVSPWFEMVDPAKFSAVVKRIEALKPTVIAGAHTPVITGDRLVEAFRMMHSVPGQPAAQFPTQDDLEAMIAAIRVVHPDEKAA